ncbi:MAG: 5-histidylcysteine sulfoxide synthase [Planctomycetes bacterium]|nr:5-histidylcysteine sulfoxide synthase [Planctomycetota bacterium]
MFYYVHPAALYVNKLRVAGLRNGPVDAWYEQLFETGVDEMSWDDLDRKPTDWPGLDACRAYRRKVYQLVRSIIAEHPGLADGHDRIGFDSPLWALFLGFEHERIHLETSSVLIRELPVELVRRPAQLPPPHPSARTVAADELPAWREPVAGRDFPDNPLLPAPGGRVRIGKDPAFPSYGWDNEYGRREVDVAPFAASRHVVSNGEFHAFVAAGGYRDQALWSEAGWRWRTFRNVKWPTFWVACGPQGSHQFLLRTVFEIVAMPWDWPAVVNFYEAQAFCAWRSRRDGHAVPLRLLTEAEHHRLRDLAGFGCGDADAWRMHGDASLNLALRHGSEAPVTADGRPFSDLFGNVWQWGEDHFHPLPGFAVHPCYDDFSTPCFDGRHQMIFGGSFVSCGDEATVHQRFHFRPHFFQHAGFRVVDPLRSGNDGAAVRLAGPAAAPAPAAQRPLDLPPAEAQRAVQVVGDAILAWYARLPRLAPAGTAHDPATAGIRRDWRPPIAASPLPEHGEPLEPLVRRVLDEVAPDGQVVGHPGYLAYVAGAGNLISVLGHSLALAVNSFTGNHHTAPAMVHLEDQVLRWFAAIVGYPEQAGGVLTSGSSLALLSAVVAARERARAPWDKARIYVSDQTHHAVGKALFAAGFTRENLVVLPSRDYRLDVERLAERLAADRARGLVPVLVVASAGSTNTGRVDPLADVAELCARHGVFCHCDAAYGGFFRLLPEAWCLRGIELSDTVSLDPHKSLAIPYGTGALLARSLDDLRFPRGLDDSYMPPVTAGLRYEYGDLGPELSRDPRGLPVWLAIRSFGIGAFRANLREKWQLARRLATAIEATAGLELLTAPDLSILTFRARGEGDQRTQALLAAVNRSGRWFLTTCRLDGRLAIRACLLGFRCDAASVDGLVDLLRAEAGRPG